MRLHKPDDEEGLIWVAYMPSGAWLIRVEERHTRVFVRPPNRGLSPRGEFWSEGHEVEARAYIMDRQRREFEAT